MSLPRSTVPAARRRLAAALLLAATAAPLVAQENYPSRFTSEVAQHPAVRDPLAWIESNFPRDGSQFTAKDFKELVPDLGLERYHRSTREGLAAGELTNFAPANESIGRWVAHYNERRLHVARHYLPPAEYYTGKPEAWLVERRAKLTAARERRREVNRTRLQAAA